MSDVQLALLVLLLPLGSAALIALFLRRQGTLASVVSVAAAAGLAAAALTLSFGGHRNFPATWNWLTIDSFSVNIGINFDDLAALMLAIVAVVGLCVHVFSLGYMHDDGAKARYFGGLSIFMFSMVGIVFADNLFMMFIFWELVGFSSYTLINHYLHRTQAADAAKKAFITNRVGDVGFLLGIIWCYYALHTVSLAEIAKQVHDGAVVTKWIPILLFCGAVGKSAQMPLQVWLPDAMEGPTPVSALIHAATMVAAGIYMLCRIHPLFIAADPGAYHLVMWVGTATALYAALCAITQDDIKKVLAYSTLSQLGYMVAAFGLGEVNAVHAGHSDVVAGGAGAAMFHLTTHAFFKALLFLGSGSVIYGMHHEQNIFKMGGLRKKMPITFLTFTIGVLAIIGCPLLAGFFSKDAILYLAYSNNTAVFAILAFTAILTALYMVRLWAIVFLGKPESDAAEHAHEGGASMVVPLLVLALLSIAGGYTAIYGHAFDGIFSQIPHPGEELHMTILAVSVAVTVVGAAGALWFYRPGPADPLAQKAPGLFTGLVALKESFDALYGYYVEKIQQRFAMLLNGIEQIAIAGLIIRGTAGVVGLVGMGARALHVGRISGYAYWFLIGVVVVWGFAAGIF